MKKLFFIFTTLVIFHKGYSQNKSDSIINFLKSNNYEKALVHIELLTSSELKVLFRHKIVFLTKGKKDSIIVPLISEESTKKEKGIYYLLLGDYYKKQKRFKDQYIFYDKSLNIAQKLDDKTLLNESLRRLIEYELYIERDKDTLDAVKLLNKLKLNRADQSDDFWYYYRAIQVKFFLKDFRLENNTLKTALISSFLKEDIMNLFKGLKESSKGNIFHTGMYYQLLSAYQSDWLNDFASADENFVKAKDFYNRMSYYKVKDKAKGVDYNRAINLYKLKKYDEAIPVFKNNLKRDLPNLYRKNTYDWLFKCYDSIGNLREALYYFKKYDSISKEIYKNSRDVGVYKRDQIIADRESAIQEKEESDRNFYYSLSITGFIFLVLILTFYLYKRYKKKSSVLEEEKSETLQEIAELKNIVIKNHIVLKDKTKVYVADLMYIKSDDHYLRIYTQDGNDRFVRGKLSQIKEELPPNFIQCHRSYIVNSNFIKQVNSNYILLIDKTEIPLSRSYKDKF